MSSPQNQNQPYPENEPAMQAQTCSICGLTEHAPLDHPFLPNIMEGGMGSGRQNEFGGGNGGEQGGPLMTFETVSIPGNLSNVSVGAKKFNETIMKQVLDDKLKTCNCKKKKR